MAEIRYLTGGIPPPVSLDVVFLEFVPEGGEREAEVFCRLGAVPVELFQGLADEIDFEAGYDLIKGHILFTHASCAFLHDSSEGIVLPDLRRKIRLPNFSIGKQDHALHYISQFPDISRPGVRQHGLHRILRDMNVAIGNISFQEMIHQGRDVLAPIA